MIPRRPADPIRSLDRLACRGGPRIAAQFEVVAR
jgi:hypothetical protein